MRITTCSVLLVALLSSACQQQPAAVEQQQPVATTTAETAPAKATISLAQRISPLISGYWINTRYLEKVVQTRSPKAAIADFPDAPVTILIESAPAAADSTHASLVFNMHEGDEMTILFRAGKTATSLPVRRLADTKAAGSYEVAYQLSATDTILYFVKYDQRQHALSRFAYRRVAQVKPSPNPVPQLNDEVARTLNRLLVAGSYTGLDSLGRRLRVQFLPNGQVRGLPFRTYHVLEDFLGGPSGGDALIFNMYAKNQQQLAASYGRDTLQLYAQYESLEALPGTTDTTLVIKPGRLQYKLTRIAQKP